MSQLQLVQRDDEEEDLSESIDKLTAHGINAGDVKKLQDAGIYTCNGLMMHTKKNLTGIKGLCEAKVDKICEAAEKLVRKAVVKITTGGQALDELLGGGIETSQITEAFSEFRSEERSQLQLVQREEIDEEEDLIEAIDKPLVGSEMMLHFEREEVEDVDSPSLEAEDVDSDSVTGVSEKENEPPVGYHFKPTDPEIARLLRMKILKMRIRNNAVYDDEIYCKTPSALTKNVAPSFEDCYLFFTSRRRIPGTDKFIRTVGSLGSWEGNGRVLAIKDDDGKLIGLCSSFSFVSKQGVRNVWRMIEYYLPSTSKLQNPNDHVICKIFRVDSKGVATAKEPTTTTTIIPKKNVKKGFSEADNVIAAAEVLPTRLRSAMKLITRSEQSTSVVQPTKKRTPRFPVAVESGPEDDGTKTVDETTAAATRVMTTSESDERETITIGGTKTAAAAATRVLTITDSGEGTTKEDETMPRIIMDMADTRESRVSDAVEEGTIRETEEEASHMTSNLMRCLRDVE